MLVDVDRRRQCLDSTPAVRPATRACAAGPIHPPWKRSSPSDDIEWQAIGGRFRGANAGRTYLQDWFRHFDDLAVEVLEFIDLGNDRVVNWVRLRGRSKGSGIEPPPAYFATVIELRDGKIARAVEYATLEEAVQAASVSP